MAKDPNKPKRARTAFMYFTKGVRPEVVKENPELKFAEVGKEMGRRWKALTDADKEPYQAEADEDKERYLEEMKDYVPPPNSKGRRKKKMNDMPKRAMSAYLYFCKAHRPAVRAENPELKMVQVQSKLGEMWRNCGETEKVPYQKQAEADKRRYEAEVLKKAEEYNQAAAQADVTW